MLENKINIIFKGKEIKLSDLDKTKLYKLTLKKGNLIIPFENNFDFDSLYEEIKTLILKNNELNYLVDLYDGKLS